MWEIKTDTGIMHILPIGDVKVHYQVSTCNCNPSVQELPNGCLLLTHNSYDRREFIERLIHKDNISLN